MARYTDADCKLCRREGIKLFLKGSRCESPKCAIEKRNQPPGQHGARRMRGKDSPYQVRLREKQRARRYYGILEKQFRGYYDKAARQGGATGENLLRLLERRVDNVVYRSGFASSRDDARQMVKHRHVHVNGKLVSTPSFLVRVGDKVSIKESSRQIDRVILATEQATRRVTPGWLTVDTESRTTEIAMLPERGHIDAPVRETLIVEFYSR